jgi:TolA-binding protein
MPPVCRALLILLLLAGSRLLAATSAESQAFNTALNFRNGAVWDRAEAEFAQFIRQYTNSTLVPEAILFQAEARIKQTNYAGAIELLSANVAKAGARADEYHFWLGEAYFGKGDYKSAVNEFAKLIQEFPTSSRRLEATVEQAGAELRLDGWKQIVELLQKTNGVFYINALASPTNGLVLRGNLLLSEAHLALGEYSAAESALQPMATMQLDPRIGWQRQYLLCRIQLAQGHLEDALRESGALLTIATNTSFRGLQAESISFQAGLLERLNRLDEAINSYTNNLFIGIPPERQRQALLKIADLCLARNRVADAAQMLERYLSQHPDVESAQLAFLRLGEMRLRQHLETADSTNAAGASNFLQQAIGALKEITNKTPQSTVFGKAQLDLGWCYSLPPQPQLEASEAAFQSAFDNLPPSLNRAKACFKLADTQFLRTNYSAAIANYTLLIDKFAGIDEVRENLFEPALYQKVRAALAAGNLPVASDALKKIVEWYPTGFYSGRAVLVAGGEFSRKGDSAGARKLYLEVIERMSASPLAPELRLAVARTFEEENKWPEAIAEYDKCLTQYPTNEVRPRAEYYRAYAFYLAGNETNALTGFTNFVATFPTNELALKAQWWVADYYYRIGSLLDSEKNFQIIFQSWPASDLTYEAQLMAGRVAFARQRWEDASNYFTKILNSPAFPTPVRIKALYAYGDTLMSWDSGETNRLGNYREAIRVFDRLIHDYPTNRESVAALGEKANCLLQLAKFTHDYRAASNDFQQVIDSPLADASIRGIAKIGIAVLLEKQAQEIPVVEQKPLLRSALNHYLDVFYDAKTDLFWRKYAGIEGGRSAEAMQEWLIARNVYQQLRDLLPMLRPRLDKLIMNAQEHSARAGD